MVPILHQYLYLHAYARCKCDDAVGLFLVAFGMLVQDIYPFLCERQHGEPCGHDTSFEPVEPALQIPARGLQHAVQFGRPSSSLFARLFRKIFAQQHDSFYFLVFGS